MGAQALGHAARRDKTTERVLLGQRVMCAKGGGKTKVNSGNIST